MTTAADVGDVEMRIAKVVGLRGPEDEIVPCIVLEEVAGDRHLPITIGQAGAFSLAARLGGIEWPRPMTYQFAAALVQALAGWVRQVQIDRVVEGSYAATVEVEGPRGMQSVDARPSDALNLAVLVDAPIFAAAEVLAEAEAIRAGESAEAARLRQARGAPPMTVGTGRCRRTTSPPLGLLPATERPAAGYRARISAGWVPEGWGPHRGRTAGIEG